MSSSLCDVREQQPASQMSVGKARYDVIPERKDAILQKLAKLHQTLPAYGAQHDPDGQRSHERLSLMSWLVVKRHNPVEFQRGYAQAVRTDKGGSGMQDGIPGVMADMVALDNPSLYVSSDRIGCNDALVDVDSDDNQTEQDGLPDEAPDACDLRNVVNSMIEGIVGAPLQQQSFDTRLDPDVVEK